MTHKRHLKRFVPILAIAVFAIGIIAPISSVRAATTTTLPSSEWHVPTDKKPRVVVLVIHGGGWAGGDELPQMINSVRKLEGRVFKSTPSITNLVEYRSNAQSVPDVVAIYDQTKQKYPNLPICAIGQSAGGHLALMLATQRKLACVISEAGPTDLENSSPNLMPEAISAFSPNLRQNSPLYATKKITTPTLLVSAKTGDEWVPNSQAEAFKKRYPASKLIVLDEGKWLFVHSFTNGKQLTAARNYEMNMIRKAALKK